MNLLNNMSWNTQKDKNKEQQPKRRGVKGK